MGGIEREMAAKGGDLERHFETMEVLGESERQRVVPNIVYDDVGSWCGKPRSRDYSAPLPRKPF